MAMMMKPTKITKVWADNFKEEIDGFDLAMDSYSFISLDTEFPGFLHNTPRNASEAQRYEDLKYNVDQMKLIQVGFTLFDDDGDIGGAWEFNFSNFDLDTDLHVSTSIELLRKNGIDFEKNKREGIDMEVFVEKFWEIRLAHKRIQWVTFHGLYDLAYVTKLVTRRKLQNSVLGFANDAGNLFGRVYDVKFMARYCHGLLGGEIGLERLAKILKVERFGDTHQAGSDSLLTASVFLKMKSDYKLAEGMFAGFLYGISAKIERMRLVLAPHLSYRRPIPRCPAYYTVATPHGPFYPIIMPRGPLYNLM